MNKKVFRGYLIRFLVVNENGWGIGIFSTAKNGKSQINIKGNIALMQAKMLYEIHGEFQEHPKYGKSFNVEEFKYAEANTEEQLINYLSSPLFPGIGQKTAKAIVNFFETDVIKKIQDNPSSILEVPGVNQSILNVIIESLKQVQSDQKMLNDFFSNNLKVDILTQIKKYTQNDNEIENILKNHFFEFALEKKMTTFYDIDKIALHFGLAINSPERIAYWSTKITADILINSGNTYTTLNILKRNIIKKMEINNDEIITNGLIYAKNKELLFFVKGKIYTNESWTDENIIANKMSELVYFNNVNYLNDNIDNLIQLIEYELSIELKIPNFKYDEIQKEALKKFAEKRFFILTGGPGTGKTTVIQGITKLFKKLYDTPYIGVAAPTGRAAARIKENLSSLSATTIHKLLKADGNDSFEINEQNPLQEDLIILDESSMIESHLFSQFIQSTSHVKKIVLVGDQNQLPSVGYGNVFEDLINSKAFPIVNLEYIHRQKGDNDIIDLAYSIQNNEVDNFDFENSKNVKTFFTQNQKSDINLIKEDFQNNLKIINKNPFNYQIIAPLYAGELGIENINIEVQNQFNTNLESKLVYQRGRYRFTIGDKIMYLKNNSELDLTNGEVGIIENIVFEKNKFKYAVVNFGEDKVRELYRENFADISLSYVCSVHKTQGSEYKHLVFVIENNAKTNFFLNKKIIYTAITRAKNNLIIIGDKQTFLRAAKREAAQRQTTLIDKIKTRFKELELSINN